MGRFQRAVGVMILGTSLLGGVLLWAAVSSTERDTGSPPQEHFVLGLWRVRYDTQAPSSRELLMATALALLFAAGVAWLERRIATRSRRSEDLDLLPLAPKIVMAETR